MDLKMKGNIPMLDKFTTKKQIDAYFNDDKIECLLCGKRFKALGVHLSRKHEITGDEYKTRFGLPYGIGLAGLETKLKHSKSMKNLIEKGVVNWKNALIEAEKVRDPKKKRFQPYTRKNLSEHLKSVRHKLLQKDNLIKVQCLDCSKFIFVKEYLFILRKGKLRCEKCSCALKEKSDKRYRDRNKPALKKRNQQYRENNKNYFQQYREKNKEAIKEKNSEYREKNKGTIKEKKSEYREKNKEAIKEHNRKYREKNKEMLNKKKREQHEKNKKKKD